MTESSPKLTVGVPKETFPGERRVALVPGSLSSLLKAGLDVVVESGAGREAGFSDEQYAEAGGRLLADRDAVFSAADVLLQVRAAGANPQFYQDDLPRYRQGQTLVGLCEPLFQPRALAELAGRGVTCFALELLPRITRAQPMDVLSSMATIAGYKSVLLAADALPRMFPMLMTAAGTLTPARVLVVGAGVAGLQAIATAHRLGGVVSAYDVRPAVKEQVQSLGARFVELELPTEEAEEAGGYAQAMDEEFYRRQRELMRQVVAESDVVITTAVVPGKSAPVLIGREMVGGMRAGSVIVDLAAERGGNCEATVAGQTVVEEDVTILGPENVPSRVPYHASQMYSRNIASFLLNFLEDGTLRLDRDDKILRETLVTEGGQIIGDRVRELLEVEG